MSGKVSKKERSYLLERKFTSIPFMVDLYRETIRKSEIEKYKLEDFTIRELMKGTPRTEIIEMLKIKVPEGRFSNYDLEKFIERSRELAKLLKKEKTSLARRWLKAKTDLTEELAQLAAYTKNLIPELKEQGDNTNLLRAITAFQNIIINYASLEGLMQKGPGTQVNTQVNISYDKLEELRKRAHKANFKLETNDITTEQKKESKNKKGNNQ